MENTLEKIVDEIVRHDVENPTHGVGCACHDKHAGAIRRLLMERLQSVGEGDWKCRECGALVPAENLLGNGYGHPVTVYESGAYSEAVCGPLDPPDKERRDKSARNLAVVLRYVLRDL